MAPGALIPQGSETVAAAKRGEGRAKSGVAGEGMGGKKGGNLWKNEREVRDPKEETFENEKLTWGEEVQ